MTQEKQTEIIVDDNAGIVTYLHFDTDRKFFTFTNPRTIQEEKENKIIYYWVADVLSINNSPNDDNTIIKQSHIDFRKQINALLHNQDRKATFKVGVKVVGKDGNMIKYDFEGFERLE